MSHFDSYFQSIELLETRIHKEKHSYMKSRIGKEFFIERAKKLFERIGNPEKTVRIIHVTGTSGKGSTTKMIYEMLLEGGYTAGLFTSPYVSSAIENIQLNGHCIDPQEFAALIQEVMSVAQKIDAEDPEFSPSYAEVFFAVAMLSFQRHGVDWVVLEVGCGGRYDKTNIIPPPPFAVITNVGIDHTGVLGERLEDIAWHKAGIMKAGTETFSAETDPAIQEILKREAITAGAQIHFLAPRHPFATEMHGKHQQWNAALAEAIGQRIGLDAHTIERGIQQARMPARMELMQENPRVLLDGAHSFPKISGLVRSLDTYKPWEKLTLIFSAKEGKELTHLITPLAPLVDEVVVTTFTLPGFGSHSAEEMAELFTALNPRIPVTIEKDTRVAIQKTLAAAKKEDLVLIAGSLYLAGFARRYWIDEEDILAQRTPFPQQTLSQKAPQTPNSSI